MKPFLFENLNILYQDGDVIVTVKPTTIVSESTESGDGLCDVLGKGLGKTVYTVHRLDRATGGVTVYAKTQTAAAKLSRDIQNGNFKKTYLAVIQGRTEMNGQLTDYLYHDKTKNKSYVVKGERKGAKKAVLTFETLGVKETSVGPLSLLKINLETGRTHQIRVQFSSRGFPLLGDGRYGGNSHYPLGLFCKTLTFCHPSSQKEMTFDAEPDEPFISFFTDLL